MVGEPLCDVGTPLVSPNKSSWVNLLKIKWVIANVTAVGSPNRAERAILGRILAGALFWIVQAVFVVREPLCDVGTSSCALISLLRVI